MRKISHIEALETMSCFHNITPGQLKFILDEFDNGRGDSIIKGIIDKRYELDKLNNNI